MKFLLDGLVEALRLIVSLDPDVLDAVRVTLEVSLGALFMSALIGTPVGLLIGFRPFRGQGAVITVLNTAVGIPTVLVGLIGYAVFSRQGPLGDLDLLFTRAAILIGEMLLAIPIIITGTIAAVRNLDRRLIDTAVTLGANRRQLSLTMLSEARFTILASVVVALGRCISEVGAAMILGGNIRGHTRTITTAIALETSKGEFATAVALGLILLAMAFGVNIFLRRLQADAISRRVFR